MYSILTSIVTGLIAGVAYSLLLSAMPKDKSELNYSADEQVAKAEYVFLEGANAREDGRMDDSFMLDRFAFKRNPADRILAGALADDIMILPGADSLMVEAAYSMLAARFHEYPADDSYANAFAYYANILEDYDDLVDIYTIQDSIFTDRTDPAMNLSTALLKRYSRTFDIEDYNKAQAIFDRMQAAMGPTVELTARRLNAYALRNDTAAMVRSALELAEAAPGDVQSNLFVGRVFDVVKKPEEALKYYDKAEELDPNDGSVNLARAEFFHNQGDSIAFDREIFRALQSPTMVFEQKMQLVGDYVVNYYTDSLQHPRIENLFQTMQEVNPGEAELHALYGAYKASIGEYEPAAEQFRYSIDLQSNDPETWTKLVNVYQALNDSANIMDTSRQALNHFPGNAYFSLVVASSLALDKRYGQAIAVLDSIDVSKVPNPHGISVIEASKGDFFYQLNQPDSAFVHYTAAINADPDNYMALNNCAYHMAVAGKNLDKADVYARIACDADPQNPTYLDTYAWVLFKREDYAKAREVMEKVFELYENPEAEELFGPVSAEVYDHAGDIFYMDGDHDQAVKYWKQALKETPNDATIKKKVATKSIISE